MSRSVCRDVAVPIGDDDPATFWPARSGDLDEHGFGVRARGTSEPNPRHVFWLTLLAHPRRADRQADRGASVKRARVNVQKGQPLRAPSLLADELGDNARTRLGCPPLDLRGVLASARPRLLERAGQAEVSPRPSRLFLGHSRSAGLLYAARARSSASLAP